MTTKTSTYSYESGAQETVTLSRGPATPSGHALLKIAYSDGEIADCYVNTAWLRARLNDFGEPRPRFLGADEDAAVDYRAMWRKAERELEKAKRERDCWWRKWCETEERAVRAEWLLAKAEQERDKARAGARLAFGRCREVQAERQKVVDELYRIRAAEQPRPLTARDISEAEWDQIAARAWAYWENHMILNAHGLKRMMQSALTEPTRPEGAEEIEALLCAYGINDGEQDFADWLAKRGVRVVTEETP